MTTQQTPLSSRPASSWLGDGCRCRARRLTPGTAPGPATHAPQRFLNLTSAIHRSLPGPARRRVPVSFIGYALINGSAFLLDIACLWFLYQQLHWFYPLAVTVGYAAAGAYSLLLNRWLNFQSHGRLVTQGSRYAVGLVSQYVIFILGLSSLLHWLGMGAEPARVLSACCEGIYLYVLVRLWVFDDVAEPGSHRTHQDTRSQRPPTAHQ